MKRLLLAGAAILAAACNLAAARPPNVVLIVSDDQGYHDLGCYGNAETRTPNLDRLARQGVRLTSFYVTASVCTPSRSGLLTGRYPQRNGTYDLFRNDRVDDGHQYTPEEYAVSPEMVLGMDRREVLLSQVLAAAGYRAGIFGKWDFGQLRRFLPLSRGFDDFYGFANTGIDYFTHERYGIASMRRGNGLTTEDKETYATDLFRREAVRFVGENKNRPFFLYLPFNAPHGASNLDPEQRGLVEAPKRWLDVYAKPGMTRSELRRASYMAAVGCMDEAIGEVLDRLDRYGLADNTLVIFLSDNGGSGPGDNSPWRGGKGTMFEGGVRVPCIVRFPGRIPPGGTCDEFLTALEVFPTAAAAAGAKLPEGVVLDGFDVLPVLSGKQPSPRRAMFWELRGQRAARVGHFKWIDGPKGGGLFDLDADPGEEHDLSTERPDVLETLTARFKAWQREMRAAEPRGPLRDY